MKTLRGIVAVLMTVAVAGAALAQKRGAGSGTPQVDPSAAITVEGSVTAFQAGVGAGQPTLVVKGDDGKEYVFVLGPYRFLKNEGFAAAEGDRVRVVAYPCAQCPSGLVPAQITNLTRNITLTLRGSDGLPLWMAQGAGPAAGSGNRPAGTRRGSGLGTCNGLGLNLADSKTFEGTVSAFTGAPGQKHPVLSLETGQGPVEIVLAPYRVLAEAGYTPAVGNPVRVVAAPASDGDWVALTLEDLTSGLVIRFRNDAGQPVRR